MSKTYVLTFPDGLVIPAFEHSRLDVYYRYFPDSGLGTSKNSLMFTSAAMIDAGIEMAESPIIEGEPQFVAVRGAIMQGTKHVASAQSHNFAKRIARALNLHKINERGY
jgi:hypothetical protein